MWDNFLQQVVTGPTKGDNILDFVLTNNGNYMRELEVGRELGHCDSRMVRFRAVTSEPIPVSVPCFRTANY